MPRSDYNQVYRNIPQNSNSGSGVSAYSFKIQLFLSSSKPFTPLTLFTHPTSTLPQPTLTMLIGLIGLPGLTVQTLPFAQPTAGVTSNETSDSSSLISVIVHHFATILLLLSGFVRLLWLLPCSFGEKLLDRLMVIQSLQVLHG